MVQVVELADDGDPGERHLPVRRPGQPEVAVRIEDGDLVHLPPPRPERPAPALRPPAQRPVERVAVGVGEAGSLRPGSQQAGRRRPDARAHAADALALHLHDDIGHRPRPAQPRQLAIDAPPATPQALHDGLLRPPEPAP